MRSKNLRHALIKELHHAFALRLRARHGRRAKRCGPAGARPTSAVPGRGVAERMPDGYQAGRAMDGEPRTMLSEPENGTPFLNGTPFSSRYSGNRHGEPGAVPRDHDDLRAVGRPYSDGRSGCRQCGWIARKPTPSIARSAAVPSEQPPRSGLGFTSCGPRSTD